MVAFVQKRPIGSWVGVAMLVLAFSTWLAQSRYFAAHADVLAVAITLDLVLFLPVLYLVFAVRYGSSKFAAIPIFILLIIAASFVLPPDRQQALELVKILIAPLELFAAGYLIFKVRATARHFKNTHASQPGFVENLVDSLTKTLGHRRAAEIFATEFSIFYYAIFGWRAQHEAAPTERAFSCHRRSSYGAFVAGFVFLIVIESVALHLLLMAWSTTAAWIFTALSGYGIVFLLADFNAVRRRPLLIADRQLCMRVGLRWRAEIPYRCIHSIRLTKTAPADRTSLLDASLLRDHNLVLELKEPVEVIGYYGYRKRCTALALKIDDPERFKSQIETKIGSDGK